MLLQIGVIVLALIFVWITGSRIGSLGLAGAQSSGMLLILFLIFLSPRNGLYMMLFLTPLHAVFLLSDGSTLVRAIGMPTFAVWIARKLLQREPFSPLFSGALTYPMLAFLSACGISMIWSSNFGAWRNGMLTFIQLVAFVYLLIDLIDSPQVLRQAILIFLIGNLTTAGIALSQYQQIAAENLPYIIPRGVGGLGNPNLTSSSLIIAVPFFLHMIRQAGWVRLLGLTGILVAVVGIGATVSRTNLLVLALIIILQLFDWKTIDFRFAALLLIAVTILTVSPILPWESIQARFLKLGASRILSFNGRVQYLELGLQQFKRYPLGQGLRNAYFDGNYIYYHNQFVQVLVELGIPGALILAWLWWVAWRRVAEVRDHVHTTLVNAEAQSFISALRFSLLGYFLYSMTASNEDARLLWLLFALTEISYRLALKLPHEEKDKTILLHSAKVSLA
jgi:O-antigen ligase